MPTGQLIQSIYDYLVWERLLCNLYAPRVHWLITRLPVSLNITVPSVYTLGCDYRMVTIFLKYTLNAPMKVWNLCLMFFNSDTDFGINDVTLLAYLKEYKSSSSSRNLPLSLNNHFSQKSNHHSWYDLFHNYQITSLSSRPLLFET